MKCCRARPQRRAQGTLEPDFDILPFLCERFSDHAITASAFTGNSISNLMSTGIHESGSDRVLKGPSSIGAYSNYLAVSGDWAPFCPFLGIAHSKNPDFRPDFGRDCFHFRIARTCFDRARCQGMPFTLRTCPQSPRIPLQLTTT